MHKCFSIDTAYKRNAIDYKKGHFSIHILILLYITVESFYISEQLFTIKMSSLKEAKSRNVFSTSFHSQKKRTKSVSFIFLCVQSFVNLYEDGFELKYTFRDLVAFTIQLNNEGNFIRLDAYMYCVYIFFSFSVSM